MAKRKNFTEPGFLPVANPDLGHWNRELRRSSAASPQTPKPRKGTRRQREREAIRDQNREH